MKYRILRAMRLISLKRLINWFRIPVKGTHNIKILGIYTLEEYLNVKKAS